MFSGEGTPVGLLLMPPDELGAKRDALSLDEETGLESTRIRLLRPDGKPLPSRDKIEAAWIRRRNVPAVRVTRKSNLLEIEETFFCPDRGRATIVRIVEIRSLSSETADLTFETGLPGRNLARNLALLPGGSEKIVIAYSLRDGAAELAFAPDFDELAALPAARGDRAAAADASFGSAPLDRFFLASVNQLPAVVSDTGVVDASIWQYRREWVRDHAWMAVGLLLAGRPTEARVLLERLLKDFVTMEGDPVDSSRRRLPDEVELDQNGELLYALERYTSWTGDTELVRSFWDRVTALADFPLRPVFRHEPSGLLANVREYWERHAAHGIERGMELAHQIFVHLGWESAAGLARKLGHSSQAEHWEREAHRLRRAVLDPDTGLVAQGRFIKRRGADGRIQERISPLRDSGLPDGSPLGAPGEHPIEPDTTIALPTAFDFVPGDSPLSRQSLAALDPLWNQTWQGGGYGRYHADSEPDAAGGWPFPSLFAARAALECGDHARVWKVLDWLDRVPEAASGAWPEFYGEAHAPPFAQIGIPPWNWSEMLLLLVHHLLGIRPGLERLTIRPRPLPGLSRMSAEFPLRGRRMRIVVSAGRPLNAPLFKLDGRAVSQTGAALVLPYPDGDFEITVELP